LLLAAEQQLARAVVLRPGDIVITADIQPALPGGGHDYGIVRIDPVTGDRTVISDQLIGTGAPLQGPEAVEIAPDGSILVADAFWGIERVDPVTGNRASINSAPESSAVHQVGNEVYYSGLGALHGFNATTLHNNFSSNGTGPHFDGPGQPHGFAIIGNVAYAATWASDISVAADGIVGIDLTTGNRTLISGTVRNTSTSAGSGPVWNLLDDVAVDATGQLLVTSAATNGVMRIDPVTGGRAIVTSDSIGAGPQFPTRDPNGVVNGLAVAADGTILLNEREAGGVWAVDPITGNRTIVSDATHGAGPLLALNYVPGGIAVVPAPEPATFVLAATGALALTVVLRSRKSR
jgi:streptogramin lyase